MQTEQEIVLTLKKDGKLKAIVFNDMKLRTPVLYACEQMDMEEIKTLLQKDMFTDEK